MGVTETSKEAYRTLDMLGQRQRVVYRQIELMEQRAKDSNELPSNADVARELGWAINQVTPRALELRKGGFVRVHGSKKDKLTGKTVQTLCISDPNDKQLIDLFKAEQDEPENKAVPWLYD